ncbi:MAG: aspartate-semialdehyde dehydrogenase [Candidatus Firestonebacteria bacterium]
MKSYNVSIVGATGAVGIKMREILEERNFPIKNLILLASSRSVGKKFSFKGVEFTVQELTKDSFKGVDIALFSAGGGISKEYCPMAAKSGAVVIDNSSAWRMDKEVPLVVPEVNPKAIKTHKGIIANPNCSTIQMVVVLNPLHKAAKIKRIVVATYQAVSGKGLKAIDELEKQIKAISKGEKPIVQVFPHQIAYNVLPHIDDFLPNGYTKEEMKMVNETRKIMGDDSIRITATTVRVPVFNCHSEAVNIETERKLSPNEAREILKKAPGVIVVDDPSQNKYPLAIDASGRDESYVGRIREDESISNGLNLWIVGDNIRKGAATNAVQIAEYIINEKH